MEEEKKAAAAEGPSPIQILGQQYSQFCMQLGDIITKIDLLLTDKMQIKEKIMEINKKAVKLNAETQAKNEKPTS